MYIPLDADISRGGRTATTETLLEVEKQRAKERMEATQLIGKGIQKSMAVAKPPLPSEKGKSRDIVARCAGFGHSERKKLTINSKNIIIFGHRRYLAAEEVGLDEVPTNIRDFETEEDELEALILDNAYRVKTIEQKVREAKVLEEVETKRAKERKAEGRNQYSSLPDDSSGRLLKGDTRDIVASKVGFKSGRQYNRAKNVVKKIDALKETGNTDDAELLSEILNKSASTAEEFTQKVDIVNLDEETKQGIKSGEVSVLSDSLTNIIKFIKQPSKLLVALE